MLHKTHMNYHFASPFPQMTDSDWGALVCCDNQLLAFSVVHKPEAWIRKHSQTLQPLNFWICGSLKIGVWTGSHKWWNALFSFQFSQFQFSQWENWPFHLTAFVSSFSEAQVLFLLCVNQTDCLRNSLKKKRRKHTKKTPFILFLFVCFFNQHFLNLR